MTCLLNSLLITFSLSLVGGMVCAHGWWGLLTIPVILFFWLIFNLILGKNPR